MTEYDWIWLNMTKYDYDWIWQNMTEYDWIWLSMIMTESPNLKSIKQIINQSILKWDKNVFICLIDLKPSFQIDDETNEGIVKQAWHRLWLALGLGLNL